MLGKGDTFDRRWRIVLNQCGIKRLVTGPARSILGALAWCVAAIDLSHRQRHIKLRAKCPAMLLEFVGRSLYAMVNMEGMHLPGPFFGASQQQCRRISSAAVGHDQRQRRRKNRYGRGQRCSHTLADHVLFGRRLGVGETAIAL